MKSNVPATKVNEAAEAILDAIIAKADKVSPEAIQALSEAFVNVVNTSVDADREPRGRAYMPR